MKIAFLGWEFPPKSSGGLGRHTFFLAKALVNLGHEIHLFLPSFNSPKAKIVEGIRIEPVNCDDAEGYSQILSNKSLNNFDIIHGHDWPSINALLVQSKPKVLTIHSTEFDRSGGRLFKGSRIFELERKGVREADAVITVSHMMRKRVCELCETNRKISVIHNGVEDAKIIVTPKQDTLLFVGRLTEQKGVEYLLLALREAPKARLWIAGSGHLSAKLKHFAKLLGVEKRTIFLGRVSDKKLGELYSKATAVVMPSLYEPFGIVALEALAYGKPLLVSKDAGVSEILKNKKNAIFINPKDASSFAKSINSVLSSPSLRKTLSKNGTAIAKKQSWEAVAETTEKLYIRLSEKL